MALDEALLESVGEFGAMPVLRLYGWEPPCLSLGYAQPFNDVDSDRLQAFGWSLVRRPTGGRGILHADELTYSVIAPLNEPRVKGGVIESYRRLSQALLRALSLLGLEARADQEYQHLTDAPKNAAVCFEVPSNYEITVHGKKLIGSAQARKYRGVLQHGALPLCGDLGRIVSVLKYPDEDAREQARHRLLSHAVTLESVAKSVPSWQEAAQAFQKAFAEVLDLNFVEELPSETEINRAHALMAEKYANPSWLEHI